MSSGETSEQQPEITADEEWKQRVKAEDAALDQQRQEEAAEKDSGESDHGSEAKDPDPRIDPKQIPPADFSILVGMFSTQAMVALGMISDPATGKADPQLELARYFIDLLGVVDEKTKGNLELNEQSLLESTLHQLRMAYLEKSNSSS